MGMLHLKDETSDLFKQYKEYMDTFFPEKKPTMDSVLRELIESSQHFAGMAEYEKIKKSTIETVKKKFVLK